MNALKEILSGYVEILVKDLQTGRSFIPVCATCISGGMEILCVYYWSMMTRLPELV